MKRYTYKNRKTGKKVQSDKPLTNADLVLIAQVRDGQMKGKRITQK